MLGSEWSISNNPPGVKLFQNTVKSGKTGKGAGLTNERPGTDHVILGPMRGLKKTASDGADR